MDRNDRNNIIWAVVISLLLLAAQIGLHFLDKR
jgi:hypothetical protein